MKFTMKYWIRHFFTEDCGDGIRVAIADSNNIEWTSTMTKHELVVATDEENWLKTYVAFAQKYAAVVAGPRNLSEFYKNNPSKTLFDYLNPSDEAFALLVVKNNQDVWYSKHEKKCIKDLKIKNGQRSSSEDDTDDDSDSAMPRYTGVESKKNAYLSSGWSEDGLNYFKEMFADIWERNQDPVKVKALKDAWTTLEFGKIREIRQNRGKKRKVAAPAVTPVKEAPIITIDEPLYGSKSDILNQTFV